MNVTALWYNSIGVGEDDDGGDDMLQLLTAEDKKTTF